MEFIANVKDASIVRENTQNAKSKLKILEGKRALKKIQSDFYFLSIFVYLLKTSLVKAPNYIKLEYIHYHYL